MMGRFKYLIHIAIFCVFALIPPFATATEETNTTGVFKPYTADYTLHKLGMNIANIRYDLSHTDSELTLSVVAKPKGLAAWISSHPISETSTMNWTDGKLQPLIYSRKYTGKENAKIQDMQINYYYDKNKALVKLGNTDYQFEIGDSLWDEVSILPALMLDLEKNKTNLEYRLIDNDEIEEHRYTIEKNEIIETIAGKQEAIKIAREHGNRKTLMWFAPELNFLLLKVEQYRKGKLKSEMILKALADSSGLP